MPGTFPSLLIRAAELVPQGAFAEAQAEFLRPDPGVTKRLRGLCEERSVGVVAHYYMDPELQGALSGCGWRHVSISDSLKMADEAIAMAQAGVRHVVVLGVDFMSENVRAMLDAAGHAELPVYRVAAEPIGCSLAESADAPAYAAYLAKAARTERSLHVIYINTSLEVKAHAHRLVPTITCTSSNVVQAVLQAFAQIPGLSLWFGPDTYMGQNLVELFEGLASLDDAAIAALHPEHDRASVAAAMERFHYFQQGNCVVHHMFGREVADVVQRDYPDVDVTAHLEVPGEMFRLALEAQRQGRGVVGSTSNILAHIANKVARGGGRQRFVLGTEAGMITSIVRKVQSILREGATNAAKEVEIIFPVAAEAITQTDDRELGIVPGVSGGEGCSTAGGCATCPYMKMNSLDALTDLLESMAPPGSPEREDLARLYPRKYTAIVDGRAVSDLGTEPILHMRHLQKHGALPDALVDDILSRRAAG